MQPKQGTNKVVMTDSSNVPISQSLLLVGDPEIQRTRKILSIILGILLALSVVSTITTIYGNRIANDIKGTNRDAQIGQSLISILFYSFGLFVAYRYYETGLQVFAWLGIIILIMMGIVIVVLVFVGITVSTTTNFANDDQNKGLMISASVGIFLVVLISFARLVFTIIIVKLAFKLAKLIVVKRSLATQQTQFSHLPFLSPLATQK